MTNNSTSTERDLVLPPNTHAFILNQQKGDVDVFCGPHKSNLDANTDRPVMWDYTRKRFVECQLSQAIRSNMIAPEGWYLILKNPENNDSHPHSGQNSKVDLRVGRKINVQGPTNFALWPGQMCKVVQGHHLRSNQYLIVRVYDEESAKENWNKSVIKTITSEENDPNPKETLKETETTNVASVKEEDISMGKLFIIKGTEVSFYIPPTGVEVLHDKGEYVQNAVTLERLEYCLLLAENGNKQYVDGPAVVFPNPTQQFIEDKQKNRKYRAITMNDISGLYISVVKSYSEGGIDYKAGEELFITGKECSIYFPREEHAIIKYGNKQKHHAIAVPVGEGRYLMNRQTGEIKLVKGSKMLLPDPRTQVIVRRILTEAQAKYWFPGNEEVVNYNSKLRSIQEKDKSDYITTDLLSRGMGIADLDSVAMASAVTYSAPRAKASKKLAGDVITRGSEFTKPRTICLDDSKYDGAVGINVWRGYAICVESKTKESEIIVGSCSKLLEYDEELVVMELSKGVPKNKTAKVKTPYLRILNNKIHDVVSVTTKDLCTVDIELSYMVNFAEAEKDKWFNVENYVQFLCERMRSMIKRMVKDYGIEKFHQDYIVLIRDLVLNKIATSENALPEGRHFEENGMYISDVEVANLAFDDNEIEEMLNSSQNEIVRQSLQIASNERQLTLVEKSNDIQQLIDAKKSETRVKAMVLDTEEKEKELEVKLIDVTTDNKVEVSRKGFELERQGVLASIEKAKIERRKDGHVEEQEHQTALVNIKGEELVKESKAFAERFKAITPNLISALQQLGDKNLAMSVSKNLSIHTLLGDKNLMDVLKGALGNTALGNNLEGITNGYKNLQKKLTTKDK